MLFTILWTNSMRDKGSFWFSMVILGPFHASKIHYLPGLQEHSKENSECLWENSKKIRKKVLWPQFLQKHRIFLGMCLHVLPRCSGEKWASFRLALTLGFCYLCTWPCAEAGFCHAPFAPVIAHFIPLTPLNPQGIKCLMLWMKLAFPVRSWLTHLQASVSQVPWPLEQYTLGLCYKRVNL